MYLRKKGKGLSYPSACTRGMCLHIPCGQWEFELPSQTEEKYSSLVIVYIDLFSMRWGKTQSEPDLAIVGIDMD